MCLQQILMSYRNMLGPCELQKAKNELKEKKRKYVRKFSLYSSFYLLITTKSGQCGSRF